MAFRSLERLVRWNLLFLLLAFKPSAGQSTIEGSTIFTRNGIGDGPGCRSIFVEVKESKTTKLRSTVSPCLGCTLNPEVTEYVTAPSSTRDPTVTAPSTSMTPRIYSIIFAAYSITSEYILNGTCITASGRSSNVPTNITVHAESTADPTALRSAAVSLFREVLGFNRCSNDDAGVVNYPSATITGLSPRASLNKLSVAPVVLLTATISPIPSPSSAQTDVSPESATTSYSRKGLSMSEKVAIGVVVPIIAIASFLLGMIHLQRRRKRSLLAKENSNIGNSADNIQPYLQQKAELEAEEKRRLELEAEEIRYEFDDAERVHEIPGGEVRNELDTHVRPGMPTLRGMHELRGEDCSKELEAP